MHPLLWGNLAVSMKDHSKSNRAEEIRRRLFVPSGENCWGHGWDCENGMKGMMGRMAGMI